MNSRKTLFSLIAATVLLGGAGAARAHTPPPVYVTYTLEDEALRLEAVLNTDLFADWVGGSVVDLEPDDEELLSRVRAFLEDTVRVKVDGVETAPDEVSVEKVEYQDHGLPWTYGKLIARYPLKKPPRRLALAWTRFENSIGWYISFVEGELNAYGGGPYLEFTPEEPEYVWHAPAKGGTRPAVPPETGGGRPPARLDLPLAALGVLVLLLLVVPLFALRRPGGLLAWGNTAVRGGALAMVLAFGHVAEVQVEAPWPAPFERPTEEQAARTFTALLRNIYEAFNYDQESAIYETLAESVRGPLLTDIYVEVYESLVMEDQGGAVARIRGVKPISCEISFPEDESAERYRVDAVWQVLGQVEHWGHTHRRVNEHHALFTVDWGADGWKISSQEVLDQRRVEGAEAANWSTEREPR